MSDYNYHGRNAKQSYENQMPSVAEVLAKIMEQLNGLEHNMTRNVTRTKSKIPFSQERVDNQTKLVRNKNDFETIVSHNLVDNDVTKGELSKSNGEIIPNNFSHKSLNKTNKISNLRVAEQSSRAIYMPTLIDQDRFVLYKHWHPFESTPNKTDDDVSQPDSDSDSIGDNKFRLKLESDSTDTEVTKTSVIDSDSVDENSALVSSETSSNDTSYLSNELRFDTPIELSPISVEETHMSVFPLETSEQSVLFHSSKICQNRSWDWRFVFDGIPREELTLMNNSPLIIFDKSSSVIVSDNDQSFFIESKKNIEQTLSTQPIMSYHIKPLDFSHLTVSDLNDDEFEQIVSTKVDMSLIIQRVEPASSERFRTISVPIRLSFNLNEFFLLNNNPQNDRHFLRLNYNFKTLCLTPIENSSSQIETIVRLNSLNLLKPFGLDHTINPVQTMSLVPYKPRLSLIELFNRPLSEPVERETQIPCLSIPKKIKQFLIKTISLMIIMLINLLFKSVDRVQNNSELKTPPKPIKQFISPSEFPTAVDKPIDTSFQSETEVVDLCSVCLKPFDYKRQTVQRFNPKLNSKETCLPIIYISYLVNVYHSFRGYCPSKDLFRFESLLLDTIDLLIGSDFKMDYKSPGLITYGIKQCKVYDPGGRLILNMVYLFPNLSLHDSETDHRSPNYLMKVKDPCSNLARFVLRLQEYTFEIKYSSNKSHTDVDCFSRSLLDARLEDENLIEFPFYSLNTNQNPIDLLDPSPLDSVADIVSAQQREQFCLRYFAILSSDNQRMIARRAKNFCVINSTLYWIDNSGPEKRYLLVIILELVPVIIEVCNDRHAHLAMIKTSHVLPKEAINKNMFVIIRDHVISCVECQKRKVGHHKSAGLYQPIPVTTRIFDTFSIDLLGPVPESDGYKYCFVMVDQLSHMILIEPLKETSGDTILETMKNRVFLKFGFPTKIIADRGLNVSGQFAYDFYRRFGINLIRTTSFHPQTNGMVESLNRLIGHSLAIFCSSQKEWHKYCPFIEFCYNTTPNVTTGLSPFYVAYGQEARIPVEAVTGRLELRENFETNKNQENADLFADQLALIRRIARDNYVRAQNKRKPMTDIHRTHVEFKISEEVLVYQNQSKITTGGKLKPRYSGPWIVLRKFSPNTYLVTIADRRGKGRHYENDIVNVCRMKRDVRRDRLKDNILDPPLANNSPRNAVHSRDRLKDNVLDPPLTEDSPEVIVRGNDDTQPIEGSQNEPGDTDVGSEPLDYPFEDVVPRGPPKPLRKPTRNRRPPKRLGDYLTY